MSQGGHAFAYAVDMPVVADLQHTTTSRLHVFTHLYPASRATVTDCAVCSDRATPNPSKGMELPEFRFTVELIDRVIANNEQTSAL